MATKSVSAGSSSGVSASLKLTMTQGTQSIDNNNSEVNYKLELIISGGNWRADTCSWGIKKTNSSGEVVKSGSLTKAYRTGTVLLGSGSYSVQHDANGNASTTLYFYITSSFMVNANSTLALTLDTIPRGSDIEISSATSGIQTQITIKPKTTTFADAITATYPNGETQVIRSVANRGTGSTSGYTVNWTPSTQKMVSSTTSSSATVVVTTTTYKSTSDDTIIASKSANVLVTVGADSDSKPTIGTLTLSENNPVLSSSTKTALGISDGYLQNVSIIKAVASGITLKGSATVETGLAIFNNAIQIQGTKDGNNINFITNTIISPASGNNNYPISAVVTDSRGISSDAKASSYKVYGYSTPIITYLDYDRCRSDGSYDTAGEAIKIILSGNITNINSNNKNAKLWKIYWKKADGTWTDSNSGSATLNSTSYSLTNQTFIVTNRTFSANSSWVIKIEASDTLNVYTSQEYTIGVGADLVHISANGKSIGVGQRSTATGSDAKLEIALDTYIGDSNNTKSLTVNGAISATNNITSSGALKTISGLILKNGNTDTSVIYPNPNSENNDPVINKNVRISGDGNGDATANQHSLLEMINRIGALEGLISSGGSAQNGWLIVGSILIQWRTLSISKTGNSSTWGNSWWGSGRWTFTKEFAEIPTVVVAAIDNQSGLYAAAVENSPTATGVQIEPFGSANFSSCYVNCIAIGVKKS